MGVVGGSTRRGLVWAGLEHGLLGSFQEVYLESSGHQLSVC